jgi:type IV pilus assembly protein PilC
MNKHSIFDKKMISLIKVADESNQNETIFKRLTEQYSEEIEYQSKMISSTIEPFIILILGAIVGVILIAMYLPMFKLSSVIGN